MNYKIKFQKFTYLEDLNPFLEKENIEYEDIVNFIPGHPSCLIYRVRVVKEEKIVDRPVLENGKDILVNGNNFYIVSEKVSYDDVVHFSRLIGTYPKVSNPTVVYRCPNEVPGFLLPGQSINVVNGMTFKVT